MNRLLVITDSYPEPDKASGDLRLFTFLQLLSRKHEVLLCASDKSTDRKADVAAKQRLIQAGIRVNEETNVQQALKHFRPDIVWFEFFYQVREDYMRLIDRYCPKARLVVDSVDVHFSRLETRARLTEEPEDVAKASEVKTRELAAYARADMVIAVSEDDRKLLQLEIPNVAIDVIPNIHAIPAYTSPDHRSYGQLVFVGGFKHDPNVDAMLYFCGEVLPLIRTACPEAHLKIIGSNPPGAIEALASDHVEILGFVPETGPHLQTAYISVAPLRYGGGMKGKVGEAMSYGLPVVTTSFGAEGFGLVSGRDLLIGDDANAFAEQVVALLNDSELHGRISRSGYDFISSRYSVAVVEQTLLSTIRRLADRPPRKIPRSRKIAGQLQTFYLRHIAWRLPRKHGV